MTAVKNRLVTNLERLRAQPMTKLLADRYQRLMSYGAYETKH
jgi:acetyl-CoA carboxylase carboxyl transferase subunit alpha